MDIDHLNGSNYTNSMNRTISRIPLILLSLRCGVTKKDEGVLSAVVVVQHHPVLQRKGDKAVQLLCYFAAQDKVVTNSYDVLAE